ncbi:MAG: hypothetical protein IIA72_05425 [Proteobacteria bacterium]|nr:hypothetical protein [Pseudomonadota bacterium]
MFSALIVDAGGGWRKADRNIEAATLLAMAGNVESPGNRLPFNAEAKLFRRPAASNTAAAPRWRFSTTSPWVTSTSTGSVDSERRSAPAAGAAMA